MSGKATVSAVDWEWRGGEVREMRLKCLDEWEHTYTLFRWERGSHHQNTVANHNGPYDS